MCITDRGDSPSTVAGPSSGVPSRLSSPLVQPLAGADESDDADMAGESTLFRPIYTGNFVSNANANAKANVKSGLPTQETYQNQNHIQQNQMQNSFNALEECALQQEIVWALEIVPGSKFLKTLLRKHRSHYIRTDSARAQLWHVSNYYGCYGYIYISILSLVNSSITPHNITGIAHSHRPNISTTLYIVCVYVMCSSSKTSS